ncbi:hypothetical protein D3C85_1663720 [compost metagenome]
MIDDPYTCRITDTLSIRRLRPFGHSHGLRSTVSTPLLSAKPLGYRNSGAAQASSLSTHGSIIGRTPWDRNRADVVAGYR